MSTQTQRTIHWTHRKLQALDRALKTAQENHLQKFTVIFFDGEIAEFVTSYAQYLSQYLHTKIFPYNTNTNTTQIQHKMEKPQANQSEYKIVETVRNAMAREIIRSMHPTERAIEARKTLIEAQRQYREAIRDAVYDAQK